MEIQIYTKEWKALEMATTWVNLQEAFLVYISLKDNWNYNYNRMTEWGNKQVPQKQLNSWVDLLKKQNKPKKPFQCPGIRPKTYNTLRCVHS